jgi:hypothetical protein
MGRSVLWGISGVHNQQLCVVDQSEKLRVPIEQMMAANNAKYLKARPPSLTSGKRWYAVCMRRAIAYLRVSTQQQHRSGLGIEAQRATIARFAEAEGLRIIGEFVEAETGKGADALDRRPQLAAALPAARSNKCSVLVSKLYRLSRDVAFVSGLMAQRVPFIVADRRTNRSSCKIWRRTSRELREPISAGAL